MSRTSTYKEYTIYRDTSGLKIEERVKEESSSGSFFIIIIAIIAILFFCDNENLNSNFLESSSTEIVNESYEANTDSLNESLIGIIDEVFNEFDTTLSNM